LQQEIETKYPNAYEYVNIKPAKVVTVVDENLIQHLRNEIEALNIRHKQELAEKDKLIVPLNEDEWQELRNLLAKVRRARLEGKSIFTD
jgi:hypothetical protein